MNVTMADLERVAKEIEDLKRELAAKRGELHRSRGRETLREIVDRNQAWERARKHI